VRYVQNKAAAIHDVIADHQLDFLALCETWIRLDDSPVCHRCCTGWLQNRQRRSLPRICSIVNVIGQQTKHWWRPGCHLPWWSDGSSVPASRQTAGGVVIELHCSSSASAQSHRFLLSSTFTVHLPLMYVFSSCPVGAIICCCAETSWRLVRKLMNDCQQRSWSLGWLNTSLYRHVVIDFSMS